MSDAEKGGVVVDPDASDSGLEETSRSDFTSQMSRLDMRADPFAVREGKALTWQGINMTLVRICEWSLERG